jgi:hypothetical protein
VVAVAVRRVGPGILVDARLLLGENFSLTHVGDSTRSGRRVPG